MTLLLKIRQAVCRIAFLTAVCIPLRAQQLPPLQPSQDTRQFLQEFLQQLMNTAQEPQVQASGADLAPQDILAVSLAFSGCLPGTPEADDVMGRYNELAAIVTSPEYAALPEPQRAERILTLIYEQVLKQYQADQTSIPVMFSKGTYNCVSSTVLYMSLARAAGLDVRAQRTPDHAFCTLYTSGGADVRPVDIETTNPRGFDPGKRRQIASNRYYIVPKKSYAGRHQISARMLAGLTARNLSILYMNANDYEHAVPLARQVVELLRALKEIDGDCALMFPSPFSRSQPISDMGLLNALRRLGHTREEICIHGFRSSASTLLNAMGKYTPDVIEAQLAHQEQNAVRAAYNRADYMEQRRAMMQAWADYIDELRAMAMKRAEA